MSTTTAPALPAPALPVAAMPVVAMPVAAPPAAVDALHCGDLTLAVALGVARPAPRAVRVPSVAVRRVAGQSPLEARGWASADAAAE
ncbi:hypothetical protein GC089_03620 [Cellulomonas sp. JZ18]|uniref:hypothetical protein n=1 Tax=Cellulomonas sp. JZ18 TaxID=2654191 RepID=UPI0012D49A11|nr:hypothetical protein [Cellulomonas sp. JZ18]QGQ18508.1 hypothetical protein GC089_03620 [Cellulomonas sp. JZ18]